MSTRKSTDKIPATDEAWEDRRLGADEVHARPAPAELEAALDEALELQTISIRLPKGLIAAYKLIAAHHGVGYQPLMRDILQRFVPHGLKEVVAHHEAKVREVEERLGALVEEQKKVA
ncbi:MAG: hypothetical protein RMK60_09610 [Burkholderiales bacterium]|nr:hypothetical protein [Burkholderiales bacterium]